MGGAAPIVGWIPDGDFSDRLAQIRSRMGWNYTEAGVACGVDGEAWTRWELEGRKPQDFEALCKRIHEATGCNLIWLMTGQGSAAAPPPLRNRRVHRRGLEPRTRWLSDDGLLSGCAGVLGGPLRREVKPSIIPRSVAA